MDDRDDGRHDMVHVLGRAVSAGDLTAARRAVALLEGFLPEPSPRHVEARRRALASMAAEGDRAAARALLVDVSRDGPDEMLMAEVLVPRAPGTQPGAFVVRRMVKGGGRVEFAVHWRDDVNGGYDHGSFWTTYAQALRDLADRTVRWADR